MKIEISDEDRKMIQEKSTKWFASQFLEWNVRKDPKAAQLYKNLFVKGYKMQLDNGAVVTVKMTRKKLKEMLGEEAYNIINDMITSNVTAGIMSWCLGVCCGCVFRYTMKPGIPSSMVQLYGATAVSSLAYLHLSDSLLKQKLNMRYYETEGKEETEHDNRVQEAC